MIKPFNTTIAECTFHSYLSNMKSNMHPYLERIFKPYYEKLKKNNIIHFTFTGTSGIGKYTQVLYFLSKLSPSGLKYEKKIVIPKQKNQDMILRVSDIHIEIDLSSLGCNAKQLWNVIYNHIQDITQYKLNTIRWILCKNLHNIHPELLDVLYYYMSNSLRYKLKFIFISESISFLPKHFLNILEIISMRRPSLVSYKQVLGIENQHIKSNELRRIESLIKFPLKDKCSIIYCHHVNISNYLLKYIHEPKSSELYEIRDMIYKILIYNINIHHCIFYLIECLTISKKINHTNQIELINALVSFYRTYYNNYRSIYHIESFIVELILIVNRKPKTNPLLINSDIL